MEDQETPGALLPPEERRAKLLAWLWEAHTLTIDAIAQHFHVSCMTVHRDLAELVRTGAVVKQRGRVSLRSAQPDVTADAAVCAHCGKPVHHRAAWIVTLADGRRWQACCAHCGLLELKGMMDIRSALATDFLYGQMVNVFQAAYVLGSDVTLCCVPSVLCFASRLEAERYQRGFGGQVLDFNAACTVLEQVHHANHA